MKNTQLKEYPVPADEVLVQRQDFGGGSGVFSNFFDELAEEDSGRRSDPQILMLETKETNPDLNDLYSENSPVYGKENDFYINDSIDRDPRLNFYDSRDEHNQSSFFTENRIDHNENNLFLNYSSRKKQPKILISRYLLGSTFGRGSYGKVKDCLDLKTYQRLAVKIISKHAIRKIFGGWSQAINEAAIMLKLPPSRHIVNLLQPLYLRDPERIALIMEYCLGSIHDLQSSGVPPSCVAFEKSNLSTLDRLKNRTSMMRIATEPVLDNVLSHEESVFHHNEDHDFNQRSYPVNTQTSQFRRLTEAQSHSYFLQIISGISYLHSQRVIHKDIKPGNLLLTTFPGCGLDHSSVEAIENDSSLNYETKWTIEEVLRMSRGYLIKITDFGVSTLLSPDNVKQVVPSGQMTLAIQPPEVAKGEVSEFDGPKLDIYSAGVSLFFMITGHVPFSTPNVLQMLDVIVNGTLVIPGHVSVNATNLINAMMTKDPNKRISLNEIWKHPWVNYYPRTHPTKQQAVDHSRKFWNIYNPNEVNETSVLRWKLHGYPIWIDPLEYLTRPQKSFPLPHIDGTGTRIFSLEECQEFFSQLSGDNENLDIENVTPFTTLSRFSGYLESYNEDGILKQSHVQFTDGYVDIPGKILVHNSDLMNQIQEDIFPYRSVADAYKEPEEDFAKKFSVFNLGHSFNDNEDDDEIGIAYPTRCRHHSSIVTENIDTKPDDLPIEYNSDQLKTAMTINSLTRNQFQTLIKRLENQNHANTPRDLQSERSYNIESTSNKFVSLSTLKETQITNNGSVSRKMLLENSVDLSIPIDNQSKNKHRRITSWFKTKFRCSFLNSGEQLETPSLSNTEPESGKKVKRKSTFLLSKASFRRKDKNS